MEYLQDRTHPILPKLFSGHEGDIKHNKNISVVNVFREIDWTLDTKIDLVLAFRERERVRYKGGEWGLKD